MTLLLPLGLVVGLLAFVFAGVLPSAFGLVAMTVVAATVYRALRDRIQNILLVFVSVFVAMTIIGSPAPRVSDLEAEKLSSSWHAGGSFDERLPVVLHLIFDEMMSSGAIDGSVPTGASTRQALYSLGAQYDLRTFDSVYSRAFFSGVSIPNLLNAEYLGRTRRSDRFPQLLETIPQNAYFEEMARRGYRTAVFQTSVLNFCANPRVRMCETFPSFDPGVMGESDLQSRVLHLVNTLLRSYEPSYISRYGQRLLSRFSLNQLDGRRLGTDGRFDVQGFGKWFDRFISFVEHIPRGTHVFAHFMVPHGPYVLSADCLVGDNRGAGYYLGTQASDDTARVRARRDYYTHYFAQLNCVRSRIADFLEAVGRNAALRDATIIIHGDHGSRISVGNLIEDYEPEDYLANYATYFAVRAPGVEPGVDCKFLSLPEAFGRYAPGAVPPTSVHDSSLPVLVKTKSGDGVILEAPMPRFGCALLNEP